MRQERHETGDRRNRRARKKSPVRLLWLAAIFIAAVIIIENTDFTFGTADMVMTEIMRLDFDPGGDFHSYGGRSFFVLTGGTVQNFSSSGSNIGELNWQSGVELQNPVMTARGNAVAIGEERGRRIYVFNQDGPGYTVNLEYPAIFYTVNQTGHLSVIMQTTDGHEVRVFAPNREEPLYRNAIRTPNVFPVSVDVTEDGRIAVIALLDVSVGMNSEVTFNLMLEADSRNWGLTDGLIASKRFAGQFVHHVRIEGNRLLAFSDTEIRGFSMPVSGVPGTAEELWQITLGNYLETFYVSDSHFAYIIGEPFLNTEGEPPGTVKIYNFNGRRISARQLDSPGQARLSMGFGGILIVSGRSFSAFNSRGNLLWTYSAPHDVRRAAFLNNTESLLIATGREVILYRRMR